jgi:hypothetical protein
MIVAVTQLTTIGPEQLEREAPEQHLEPEERAADRDVVGGGDPGRRPAGDEQARLRGVSRRRPASHEPLAAPV